LAASDRTCRACIEPTLTVARERPKKKDRADRPRVAGRCVAAVYGLDDAGSEVTECEVTGSEVTGSSSPQIALFVGLMAGLLLQPVGLQLPSVLQISQAANVVLPWQSRSIAPQPQSQASPSA
jgi:hypothetical protein